MKIINDNNIVKKGGWKQFGRNWNSIRKQSKVLEKIVLVFGGLGGKFIIRKAVKNKLNIRFYKNILMENSKHFDREQKHRSLHSIDTLWSKHGLIFVIPNSAAIKYHARTNLLQLNSYLAPIK